MSDSITLFRTWISDPLRNSLIVPSGRALAVAMTREISSAQSPVLELGPGTGVFTRQLIHRGVPQERIALVESAGSLARMLRRQFPTAVLLETDATELRRCDPFDGKKIGAVISGLPLLSMPAWRVFAILYGAFRILRPEGPSINSPTAGGARSPAMFSTGSVSRRRALNGFSRTCRPHKFIVSLRGRCRSRHDRGNRQNNS
jgi:phospholipid N-methyltransferase